MTYEDAISKPNHGNFKKVIPALQQWDMQGEAIQIDMMEAYMRQMYAAISNKEHPTKPALPDENQVVVALAKFATMVKLPPHILENWQSGQFLQDVGLLNDVVILAPNTRCPQCGGQLDGLLGIRFPRTCHGRAQCTDCDSSWQLHYVRVAA